MSNLKSLNFFPEKKYKNYTNINNNSNSEIEDEETVIQKLIEDIYKVEEKINLLSNNSDSKTKNEPKLKKLSELNNIKNDLIKNISQYNNSLSLEMKKNDISSEHKKILINELEQKINENRNKLNSFNTLNFKYLPLIKNIFSNNVEDGFLSKEQIEDVLKSNNNNETDEDEIKKINKEKEVNEASQNVIKNNIFEYKIRKEQIEENLKMLEEEKDSTNDELINILSCKESIDFVMKLIIDKLIKNKSKYNINNNFCNNNNTIDNNGEEEFDKLIEILNSDLLYLDPSKTAYRICENLYDIYDLDNNKKNSKYHNKSCMSINSCKNRSGSYENDILNDKTNMNINYYKCHKRCGSNNITNKMSDIIKDSNIEQVSNKNINISTIKKPENNLDKKILTKLIQNEIETFLSTQNFKSSYIIEENLLNDFLYNLSMIIINKIKNIVETLNKKEKNKIEYIFISSNDLMAYLCYFFKSFYYEILISNKLMFINKDFKQLKKELKKAISDTSNEMTKLENKLDEIKIKEKININMIEIIKQKTNENGNKNCMNSNLSQIEMDYIQVCIILNDSVSEREKLKKEIEKNNNDLIHKKEENEIKINKLNLEINNINNEMKEINNDIEKFTIQNNEEIINYRKIIADKFNQIKIQLNSYRNKKQDNIKEFNQFLEKINDSINKKLNKTSFNYENILKDIQDKSTENNNKNIFINGNELVINDLEKSNLEKKLLKRGKKCFYNPANPLRIMGIGINGSNTNNNFKKKLNRSMMGINSNNNNLYNIYNNLDNSININNKSMNNNKDKKLLNKTSNNIYSQNSEESKINLNLPFHNKKSNKYNISSLPNSNNKDNDKMYNLNINELIESKKNKNRSTTNIMTKIKEIKKISHKIDNIKNNNIPNINKVFYESKKSPFHTGNNNSSRVIIEEQLKLTNFIKHKNEKKANSHGKGNAPSLPLNSQNIFYKKLNPLTKNTFCYYRELLLENNQNIIKFNPLKNISFDTLCLSPYNFNKSIINLSKNYDFINIIENNKNINKIKIEDIENTVVSSNIKKIIEIFRNYMKYKDKNNFSLEEFINKEYNLIQDLEKEDIKKCTSNQNYNFSLITKKGKRLEFIICSYEEFKMWINGLAFIIKNKTELIRLNRGY